MSLSSQLFPIGVLWFFNLLLLPIAYWVAKHVPWRALLEDKGLQHRFLAVAVILMLTWRVNIDLTLDVAIHFLGIATVTLMFGWPLAIVAAFFAQLGFLFSGLDQLESLALNVFLSGVLPIWVTWKWHRFIESFQSRNPFVFIMLTGFFGALLGCLSVAALGVLLLLLGGQFEFGRELWEYAAFLPLIIVPEAVINGMLISGLSILHPNWVMAFNDERFFREPSPYDGELDPPDVHEALRLDEAEPNPNVKSSTTPPLNTSVEANNVADSTSSIEEVPIDADARYRPPADWRLPQKNDHEE